MIVAAIVEDVVDGLDAFAVEASDAAVIVAGY